MRFDEQSLPGVVLLVPEVFTDDRGAFRRNFCTRLLAENGIDFTVCQGNISENPTRYTMRGFHYQKSPSSESKILTPVSGSLYNVVVDLRASSPTYLQWAAFNLSAERRESLHVPAGCANAFLTIDMNTVVHYYMGDYFRPETYAGFRYNDPRFSVEWPHEPLVISDRDASFPDFYEQHPCG
jgi:dTDP-4-dehydrorhamnose 3,5-epimerase